MFCQNCGNMVADDCRICPTCGQPPVRGRQAMQTDLGDDAGMRLLLPVGRSFHAIIAGYLGLLSLLFIPAPFAILFGVLAILDMRKHPEKHGMGRAIFGLVMGALGSAGLVIFLVAILLHK